MARTKDVTDACDVRVVDAAKVKRVQSEVPPRAVVEDASSIFDLLGDPNRLLLVTCLLEAGELCVCDLAAAAGMSESAVSHALRLLRAAGVVKARRDGRMIHYSLLDSHVRLLLDVAYEQAKHAVSSSRDRSA
jgi:DNA-binding transcriptional ArsR family regulator